MLTLAESYTSFNGHILVVGTLVKKSIRVGTAQILETSCIDERSEVGARWLRRFLITFDEIKGVFGIDARNEREDRSGGSERLEAQHDDVEMGSVYSIKERKKR